MLKVYGITLLLFICSRQVAAQATMSAERYFERVAESNDELVGDMTSVLVKVKGNDTLKLLASYYGWIYMRINEIRPMSRLTPEFDTFIKPYIIGNDTLQVTGDEAQKLSLINYCDCKKVTASSIAEFRSKYITADNTVKDSHYPELGCIIHLAKKLRLLLFYAEETITLQTR